MSRVTRGLTAHRRHKQVLKLAKGHWGARSRLYKTAKESIEKGWLYAYRDRRQRKRQFRRLWITRINAGARQAGTTYSQLIHWLNKANVELDRKILADLALTDHAAFVEIIEFAKKSAAA